MRLFLPIRRPIKGVRRILNIQRGVILLNANVIGVKDVAERKFLQETNFQEDEFDEDIIPERRGRDQVLNRPVYPGKPNYQERWDDRRIDEFGNFLRNESDWVIEARKRNRLNG